VATKTGFSQPAESCFFDLVNPSSETENDAGRYPGIVLMRAEEK